MDRYREILPTATKAAETLPKIEQELKTDSLLTEQILSDLRWFFLKLVRTAITILRFISAPQNFAFAPDKLLHEEHLFSLWNDVSDFMDSVKERTYRISGCRTEPVGSRDGAIVYQIDVPRSLQQYGLPAQVVLPGANYDTVI